MLAKYKQLNEQMQIECNSANDYNKRFKAKEDFTKLAVDNFINICEALHQIKNELEMTKGGEWELTPQEQHILNIATQSLTNIK